MCYYYILETCVARAHLLVCKKKSLGSDKVGPCARLRGGWRAHQAAFH
jgi:hypothetical protein